MRRHSGARCGAIVEADMDGSYGLFSGAPVRADGLGRAHPQARQC